MNRVSMGMPCFCYVLKIDNFIGADRPKTCLDMMQMTWVDTS